MQLSNEVLIDRSGITSVRVITERVAVTSGQKPERKQVPAIAIAFTNAGRKRFADATLAGKQIGVIMDGKLIAAPVVREGIRGSTLILTGDFSKENADAVTAKVNAGK